MKIFIKPNIVDDEYENCLILTKIKQGKTSEEIEEEMVKSFDVSKSRANADLKNFINQLIEADVAYVK